METWVVNLFHAFHLDKALIKPAMGLGSIDVWNWSKTLCCYKLQHISGQPSILQDCLPVGYPAFQWISIMFSSTLLAILMFTPFLDKNPYNTKKQTIFKSFKPLSHLPNSKHKLQIFFCCQLSPALVTSRSHRGTRTRSPCPPRPSRRRRGRSSPWSLQQYRDLVRGWRQGLLDTWGREGRSRSV